MGLEGVSVSLDEVDLCGSVPSGRAGHRIRIRTERLAIRGWRAAGGVGVSCCYRLAFGLGPEETGSFSEHSASATVEIMAGSGRLCARDLRWSVDGVVSYSGYAYLQRRRSGTAVWRCVRGDVSRVFGV